MNRTQKSEAVAELESKFREAKVALVTTYKGLTVAQTNQFRRELRDATGECRVVKNTLTKRALAATAYGAVSDWLREDTVLVFGFDDPVAITKIVARWSENESEKLRIKGAVVEGEVFAAERVVALSKTPPMDELRAKLLALLQTPATQLVRILLEPGSSLARVLGAREKQLGQPQ